MKFTVIDDDASAIRALLAAAHSLHKEIEARNTALGVIEPGALDEEHPVAIVMAKRDAGAVDRAYTVATVEAKPRLIRVQPDPEPEPGHDPNAAGHFVRSTNGKPCCTCIGPCCNTDDGQLCTCPGCESDDHDHGDSR